MKRLTVILAAAAGFAATPVLACPMMNQAAAQGTGSAATAAMMCGRPTPTTQTQSAPGQVTPAQPGQTAAGGCACCRNMAMMQPQPGQSMPGMGGMDHQMPGMQQTPGSPAAPSPEAPKN